MQIRKLGLTCGAIVAVLAMTQGYATAADAPTGSVVAVVADLAGVGQDRLTSLVNNTKPYWDEIYDYPLEQDNNGKLVPGLAESWSVSPDHLSWTFVLRAGVKFHNGDTLTGEDAAWSWNRLMFSPDSRSVLAGYAPIVKSITADGLKVTIVTTTPQATLPLWFASTDGSMAGTVFDEKYFNDVGAEKASAFPVGTGPFKFVSANGEQSVQLTAFLDDDRSDWQKARTPGFKDVEVRAVPDPATRLALLKTQGADLVPVSLSAIDEVKAAGMKVVNNKYSNFSAFLCMGFTLNPKSPCDDVRVREALSIAIDRDAIATSLYQGQASPSAAFFGGPGTIGYPDDLVAPKYDPDRAKDLLAQAGFNDSHPLTAEIVTYDDDSDFPQLPTLAQAIAGYLQDVGVTATIRLMDWTSERGAMQQGTFTGMQNNPATSPITLYLRGIDARFNFIGDEESAYSPNGGKNGNAWNNNNLPEQQKYLDAIANEFDQDKLVQLIGQYEHFMNDKFAQMPLLASNSVFGMSNKIGSWSPIAGKPFVNNLWSLKPAQ